MNNLAQRCRAGAACRGGELHRHSAGDEQQVLGDKHPDTLTSMSNLATALQEHGAACRGGRAAPHSAGDAAAGAGGQSIRTRSQHEQPGLQRCEAWGSMQRRLSCTGRCWR